MELFNSSVSSLRGFSRATKMRHSFSLNDKSFFQGLISHSTAPEKPLYVTLISTLEEARSAFSSNFFFFLKLVGAFKFFFLQFLLVVFLQHLELLLLQQVTTPLGRIINRKRLLEFTTLVAILHPSWLITWKRLLSTHEKLLLLGPLKNVPKKHFQFANCRGCSILPTCDFIEFLTTRLQAQIFQNFSNFYLLKISDFEFF